jgi:hypothetical protein
LSLTPSSTAFITSTVSWRALHEGRRIFADVRGGRPRVSSEVRHLIIRMTGENFLWGSPRIHGELLMLGFTVSQATVSRYLPAPSRRPRQSWRSLFRNQTIAFSHHQYPEEQSDRKYRSPQVWSYWGKLVQFVAALIATVCACLSRWLGYQLPTLNARRICLLSGQRDRGVMHLARRVAAVPSRAWKTRRNRRQAAVPIRSPPYAARASPPLRPRATQDVSLVHSRAGFRHAGP